MARWGRTGRCQSIDTSWAELLKSADAVFYDHLVGKSILSLVAPHAHVECVGKRHDDEKCRHDAQREINEILIKYAQLGKRVIRLKGGDPLLFARGAEEIRALRDAGISYEVVPGITAALAASASSAIPLTLRGVSSHVIFLTGHQVEQDPAHLDWNLFARSTGTLVLYMPIKQLPTIAHKLINAGMPADTPIALIQDASLPTQKELIQKLKDVVDQPLLKSVRSPAIAVIGAVVDCHAELAWRLSKVSSTPLAGKRFLTCRPTDSTPELADRLIALGAEVHNIPMLEVAGNWQPLHRDELTSLLKPHHWLVFTSQHSVRHLADCLHALRLDGRIFAGQRLAVVGAATAEAITTHLGLYADLIASSANAETLATELIAQPTGQKSALIFKSPQSRTVIADQLLAEAWEISSVDIYRQEPIYELSPRDSALLSTTTIDGVFLTSNNIADRFIALCLDRMPTKPKLFCLSQRIADRVRELGHQATIVPDISAAGLANNQDLSS